MTSARAPKTSVVPASVLTEVPVTYVEDGPRRLATDQIGVGVD